MYINNKFKKWVITAIYSNLSILKANIKWTIKSERKLTLHFHHSRHVEGNADYIWKAIYPRKPLLLRVDYSVAHFIIGLRFNSRHTQIYHEIIILPLKIVTHLMVSKILLVIYDGTDTQKHDHFLLSFHSVQFFLHTNFLQAV